MADDKRNVADTRQENADQNAQDQDTPIAPEDLIAGGPDEDPVHRAYARVGHADTTGINGLPADDEDAGVERKELYKKGAVLVSRID